MQVACEVRRVLSSKPNRIKLSHFVLKFGAGRDTVDAEKAAERSKSTWFAILRLDKDGKPLDGVKRPVIKTPPPSPPRSAVQHPTSNMARNRR